MVEFRKCAFVDESTSRGTRGRLPISPSVYALVLAGVMIVLAVFVAGGRAQTRASNPAIGKRPFTVKDPIEMSYIRDYYQSDFEKRQPEPITSSDGKWFLLITERGDLSSNKTESTIWMFDCRAVMEYVTKHSASPPQPVPLVRMSASSNMPVISGVRWLENAQTIAFLGKNNSPWQQLFLVDVESKKLTPVSPSDVFTSSYDISGNTIAYTTLNPEKDEDSEGSPLVEVTGQSVWSSLYPQPPHLEDELSDTTSNTLHVQIGGKELPSFHVGKEPLKLFPAGGPIRQCSHCPQMAIS